MQHCSYLGRPLSKQLVVGNQNEIALIQTNFNLPNLCNREINLFTGTGQGNLIGLEEKAPGVFSNSVKGEYLKKFFKMHIGNNKSELSQKIISWLS